MHQDLESFKIYLEKQLLLERSKSEYYKAVKLFLDTYGNLEGEELQNALVDFTLVRTTSIQYRYAVRHYLVFMGRAKDYETFVKENRIRFRRQNKTSAVKIRRVLTVDDVKRLSDALPQPFNIMLSLQWDTACRVSAIVNLETANIDMDSDGQTFVRVIEKGGIARTVYISEHTTNLLLNYIEQMGKEKPRFVFERVGKTPYMRYWHYADVLRKVSFEVLGEPISTHVLRRSRAIFFLRKGHDVMTVKDALGHSHIGMTMVYLKEAGISSKALMKKEGSIWDD